MLMIKTIMSQVQEEDWSVTFDLKDAYFTSRSFKDTGDSFGSPLEGRLTNTRSCPSAWLWPRGHLPMHGCSTGPFEAPGHPCTELSGRLAHSRELVSRHRDIVLGHIPFRCRPVWLLPGYQFLQHVWPTSG